uniref:(northern house mosquito) hypothetical protein n=1 Tax=Culex pipiens TaxID=7175 RepID=A0A8D8D164_CULPI
MIESSFSCPDEEPWLRSPPLPNSRVSLSFFSISLFVTVPPEDPAAARWFKLLAEFCCCWTAFISCCSSAQLASLSTTRVKLSQLNWQNLSTVWMAAFRNIRCSLSNPSEHLVNLSCGDVCSLVNVSDDAYSCSSIGQATVKFSTLILAMVMYSGTLPLWLPLAAMLAISFKFSGSFTSDCMMNPIRCTHSRFSCLGVLLLLFGWPRLLLFCSTGAVCCSIS